MRLTAGRLLEKEKPPGVNPDGLEDRWPTSEDGTGFCLSGGTCRPVPEDYSDGAGGKEGT